MKQDYLRTRKRRGRWFHYYRRNGREITLGVHGLHPTDKRVFTAYCAEHARWEHSAPETKTPASGSFSWGLGLYRASDHWLNSLSEGTRAYRSAIYARYEKAQGDRPLPTITRAALETALQSKGGFAGKNELKALRPVFKFLAKISVMPEDITKGISIETPTIKGFPTATADEVRAYTDMWAQGTPERLVFDLGYLTGAARVDLARLSRKNIKDGLLTYTRQKTGVVAEVPITTEFEAAIAHLPEIAPAFILTSHGKPRTSNGLGNFYAAAAEAAGVTSRLHGLRKAFCVYWAERGASAHQIAAMAGHLTLKEVEVYTAAADRKRMVRMLVEGN